MKEPIPEHGFHRPCNCLDRDSNPLIDGPHEFGEGCRTWNSCFHCDNGWYPCNQYCIVMGDGS